LNGIETWKVELGGLFPIDLPTLAIWEENYGKYDLFWVKVNTI
jgi:hypothetical protein